MRKSKLARLVTYALLSLAAVSCTGNGDKAEVSELKAYTLKEALTLCETLPDRDVAECIDAANSVTWGK